MRLEGHWYVVMVTRKSGQGCQKKVNEVFFLTNLEVIDEVGLSQKIN